MAIVKHHQQSSNPFLQAIEGDIKWNTATLTYTFANDTHADYFTTDEFGFFIYAFEGDFDPLNAEDGTDRLIRQDIVTAMNAWELVAHVPHFSQTSDFDDADIKISGVSGWKSGLGFMNFPGYNHKNPSDFESLFLVASDHALSDRPEKGGGHLGSYNALHELGHGLGLGHPHDNGGHSLEVAAQAENAEDAVWDNQRYTVLSYEKPGWNENYLGIYGFTVTPSVLDIAAIQNMYGAKNAHENNTIYTLTDARTAKLDTDGTDGTIQIGRAFYSIWDTGGSDTIAYNGQNRSILNLNNATLSLSDSKRQNDSESRLADMKGYQDLPLEIRGNIESPDYHGGGFFSTIFSDSGRVQLGGYSIAADTHHKKAKVENAQGGAGNDVIIGNELNNQLSGGAGDDMIVSSSGHDFIFADNGNDQLAGEAGRDILDGGKGDDSGYLSENAQNYNIRKIAPGITVISHERGSKRDGADILVNVEKAIFEDSTLILTPEESKRSMVENFVANEFALFGRHASIDEFIWPEEGMTKTASEASGRLRHAIETTYPETYNAADDFLI